MSTEDEGRSEEQAGKRPGKTEWAGRRRPSTRQAGFTSHADSTGGEFQSVEVGGWTMEAGTVMSVGFVIPETPSGTLVGFGGWFIAPAGFRVELQGLGRPYVLTAPASPDWSKFGSQWFSRGTEYAVEFRITATSRGTVALYSIEAGVVRHQHLDDARPGLMRNPHQIAPEANFISPELHAAISEPAFVGPAEALGGVAALYLKSCNRCARFLPVNVSNERLHLSFSNHCVAPHRRPCSHAGFGKLRNVDTGEVMQLEYGFQLECRFCKKFEVNAAHNPQRTAAQMKEDGARRRAIELLLTELYSGSPSLLYRRETGGRELADDVYNRFGGRCFKCGTYLATPKDMHLDHTRPLALLWPLDGSATALCATHNSEKRDRAPSEYYDEDELGRLATITGIPIAGLRDPGPNLDAAEKLKDRLDWFFEVFVQREELQSERDGKRAGDLLIKALQKALNRAPGGAPYNLTRLHNDWEGRRRA